ncbi:argininosuccinate lyase [Lentisalinibacter salinarum]|uniref:argininosuccinate lyase n=1 Tax=Lentisalinibacter salinarum TaxID=2992239 RepID=UPI0038662A23
MSRLWDKGGPLDERVLRYTAGEDHRLDERLVAHDVRASVAHAEMLNACGLLGDDDLAAIRDGLTRLGASHAAGEWRIGLADEDAHTALERRLTDAIGEAGGRVHLGRSRNDQVLAALRLYLKDAAATLVAGAESLAAALDRLAKRQGNVELPGYTHLQQAMPSSVALWAGGFAAALRDDAEGLRAAGRRIDRNPLGSAAGYGTPGLPLDRQQTADALGFAEVEEPVTAVQLSRGKAESGLLFEITLTLQDTARLAADLLLFYTQEFSYVSLPEAFTTGSSIMPQKRNPDVLELARAAPATAQACLDECLMVTAKLTSGYHRDLQRLKPPLFRGIDIADDTLVIMAALLDGVGFRPENVRLDPGVHAAGEANRLVTEEGIPFREAYRRVARKLSEH